MENYLSRKLGNITGVDKIPLKCDYVNENGSGIRQPLFSTFALINLLFTNC